MQSFSLPLLADYRRPIVELDGIRTLIDTGAIIPVFSMPGRVVEKMLGGEKILSHKAFGGFGGSCYGDVYALKNFCFGKLVFRRFEVFVPEDNLLTFPYLLPATAFWGLVYAFDTKAAQMVVTVPDDEPLEREFCIKDLNGKLYAQLNGVLIQEQSIFLQGLEVGVLA